MKSLGHVDVEFPRMPETMSWNPPLTDAELELFCAHNKILRIERSKEGKIMLGLPVGMLSSLAGTCISYQLRNWWHEHKRGMALGVNTGFFLPDGSMMSPRAMYLSQARVKGLTRMEMEHFLRRCPSFVIEISSDPIEFASLRMRMDQWLANGVLLGWIVDIVQRQVSIYEPAKEPLIDSGRMVAGTGPIEGFRLDTAEVWAQFEGFGEKK